MEFSYDLKIPKERVAVLIGKNGKIKKEIEEETNSKIQVDSKEGEIKITGEDSLGLFTAREIIKAIARGFNPELARLILKSDYIFDTVTISDYTGKSKKSALRLKGRVIGKEGKSRRTIEEYTETHISVYGKTIGIIGRAENAIIARKAIESLLSGSTHTSVYKWLSKKRKEFEREKFMDDRMDLVIETEDEPATESEKEKIEEKKEKDD